MQGMQGMPVMPPGLQPVLASTPSPVAPVQATLLEQVVAMIMAQNGMMPSLPGVGLSGHAAAAAAAAVKSLHTEQQSAMAAAAKTLEQQRNAMAAAAKSLHDQQQAAVATAAAAAVPAHGP